MFWYKANGLVRTMLVRNFGVLPSQIVVNEYPKCGGTWLSQMLGDLTGVGYPRLVIPTPKPNILHGHYLNSAGIKNPIVIWRDPRDVLVSHFFHCIHFKDMTSTSNTAKVRKLIGIGEADSAVFETHFPKYFELLTERKIHPYMSLEDFYAIWFKRAGCIHTSYELLKNNTSGELLRIANEIGKKKFTANETRKIVAKYDFEKVSGRKSGDEKPTDYLRKGVVGDWKNHMAGEILDAVDGQLGTYISQFENSSLNVTTP